MELGEHLSPDARFARRVGQQSGVEKGDERLWNLLESAVGGSSPNRAQDGPWLDGNVATNVGTSDRLVDLLDELSGQHDPDGDPIGVLDGRERPLHDPAEMERETVGCLCGSNTGPDRLELVTQGLELCFDRLGDQVFIQAAGVFNHRWADSLYRGVQTG